MADPIADEQTVRARLQALVAEGVLSPEQADRVAAHLGHTGAVAAAGTHPRDSAPRSRAAGVLEAAGYLGAALVAAAVWLLGDAVWLALTQGIQALLLALVAVAVGLAGHAVHSRARGGPAGRIAGVLWALGTAALGGAVAHGLDTAGAPTDWQMLAAGVLATLAGLWWWRQRPLMLQVLVLFLAVALALAGAFAVADLDPGPVTAALVTAAGAGWLAATAAGVLRPTGPSALLGALPAALGPQLATVAHPVAGPATAVATAVAVLVGGSRRSWPAPLVVGTLAATLAVLQLVDRLLPGEVGTILALLAAGAALLGGSVVTTRVTTRVTAGAGRAPRADRNG